MVGERGTTSTALVSQMQDLKFRSPGQVFKDIGNVTPRLLRSAVKNSANAGSPRYGC